MKMLFSLSTLVACSTEVAVAVIRLPLENGFIL